MCFQSEHDSSEHVFKLCSVSFVCKVNRIKVNMFSKGRGCSVAILVIRTDGRFVLTVVDNTAVRPVVPSSDEMVDHLAVVLVAPPAFVGVMASYWLGVAARVSDLLIVRFC